MTYALLYHSRAARPLSREDLGAILEEAWERNRPLGVTGVLLYARGGDAALATFAQWLEGPEAAVRPLYDAIRADGRHRDVETVAEGPARDLVGFDGPLFPDWSMALRLPDTLPTTLPAFLAYYDARVGIVGRGRSPA